ncbi:MAG: hypothetical protein IJP41_07755, partial [Synergistaceae bacterium]|nr:hypothetical protein [Synergistaceae bacterium]
SSVSDKRFGMEFVELNDVVKGHGFSLFENAPLVVGICASGLSIFRNVVKTLCRDFLLTMEAKEFNSAHDK